MRKKCLICGAEFEAAYSTAQYCSDDCRRIRMAEVKIQQELTRVKILRETRKRDAKREKELRELAEKAELQKEIFLKDATICWSCDNASVLKCPWMKDCTPVEGWTAEHHFIGKDQIESYNVRACPLYERAEREPKACEEQWI